MGDKAGDKSPEKQQQRTGKGFTFEVVLLDGEHINIELDVSTTGTSICLSLCCHNRVMQNNSLLLS